MVSIGAGLSSAKAAMEALSGLNAAINDVRVAEAKTQIIGNLIEVQSAMLDAQRTLLEDTDTIRALEARIVQLEDWSAEAERYEAKNTGQGSLAYRLKGTEGDDEDGNWLCPTCFHQRQKSFLQPEILSHGRTFILRCHPCGQEIITRGTRQEPARPALRGRR